MKVSRKISENIVTRSISRLVRTNSGPVQVYLLLDYEDRDMAHMDG